MRYLDENPFTVEEFNTYTAKFEFVSEHTFNDGEYAWAVDAPYRITSAEGINGIETYDETIANASGQFHEAESLQRAGVTDLLQEMIDKGYEIHGLETPKGWMGIHTPEDVKIAENEIATIATR